MKRFVPKFIAITFALVCVFSFFACTVKPEQPVTYTVTVQQSEGGHDKLRMRRRKNSYRQQNFGFTESRRTLRIGRFFRQRRKENSGRKRQIYGSRTKRKYRSVGKIQRKDLFFRRCRERQPRRQRTSVLRRKIGRQSAVFGSRCRAITKSFTCRLTATKSHSIKTARLQKYEGSVSAYSSIISK